jgi:hypothetical protein
VLPDECHHIYSASILSINCLTATCVIISNGSRISRMLLKKTFRKKFCITMFLTQRGWVLDRRDHSCSSPSPPTPCHDVRPSRNAHAGTTGGVHSTTCAELTGWNCHRSCQGCGKMEMKKGGRVQGMWNMQNGKILWSPATFSTVHAGSSTRRNVLRLQAAAKNTVKSTINC